MNFIKSMTLMQWVFALGVLVNIELGIAHGGVSLAGMFPDAWNSHIIAWANGLGWLGGIIMTSLAGIGVIPRVQVPMAAAKMVASFAIGTTAFALMVSPALAQSRVPTPQSRPATPIENAVQDIKNKINPAEGASTPTGLFGQPVSNAPCDFSLFAALKAENLIAQLKLCISAQFVDDVAAALDSATTVKDTVGMSCLTPGLAILKAAQTAMSPPTPAPSPTPGATPPDTPAPPATSQPPSFNPRLVLLFQKFREFGIAGGPSACKSWVQTTITMTNPVLQ